MVKVKQAENKVKNAMKKTVTSKVIKKKGTLKKNLKASKRRGFRPKSLLKKKQDKGVVYLSHIPHGFYDEQIEGFFSQFGKVSQVSVPKSKSGKSKGYAFVEFTHPEVAQIAAETMDNYLMFNRLLKAKYIPPKDQKPRLFKKAESMKEHHKTAPEQAVRNIKENRTQKNRMLKTTQEARVINKLKKKCAAMSQTMTELGVNYEIQVEEGNCNAVLKRMENLETKRKLKIEKRKELKRKQKEADKIKNENKDDSSSLSDDNLSSEDQSFSSMTTNNNPKAPDEVLIKTAKPVAASQVSKLSKLRPSKSVFLSKIIQKKQKNVKQKVNHSSKKLPNTIQGQLKQIKSPEHQQKILNKKKSPAGKALKCEQPKETSLIKESPKRKATPKVKQPFSKKSPKPAVIAPTTPKGTTKSTPKRFDHLKNTPKSTPKRFDPLKKSESVGKSPKRRKSQPF